ncbi:PREDICTED: vomeronasal type-1 receptor 1-like [Galeopterus variegatus]|uniref:Vomeronasal type-1 receptor n=1 Tax=Galeopterus variegatus TaxID=482537 RepID=A0ABM0SHW9_GALVR|nr:PREDICTED: vomeronasal type-1 receptor 1-like [Galeopterus variegatus]
MGSPNLEMEIIVLTQASIGILGNSFLLCLYNFILLTGHQVRPTDLILNQLVFANSLVLFSKGIPQTMASIGQKYFLDDAACKVVFYLHRVGRGVSLSTTCLLSVFQAVKLSSNYYARLEIRMRSPKCIGFCCLFIWILHLLLNTGVPLSITRSLNGKNISLMRKNFGYCSASFLAKFINGVHFIIFSLFDAISLGLMAWASGSMVFILQRHKLRVQYIHSSSLSKPRRSHVGRATGTILILVSSFILFYSVSSILTACLSLMDPGQWLVLTSLLVTSCFPTFSPFVLISSDTRVYYFCFSHSERKTIFFPTFSCIKGCHFSPGKSFTLSL